MSDNIWAERSWNTRLGKPNLKVYHVPASLYALEDSKIFTAKGRLQYMYAESCYISFSLLVPSRNQCKFVFHC